MKKSCKSGSLNLEKIFETIGNYSVLINLKRKIIKVNQPLIKFLGYKSENLLGRSIKDFWSAKITSLIKKTSQVGFSESEGFLINKKKQKIPVVCSLTLIKISPRGKKIIWIIYRDLTKVKRHLHRLENSLNYLESKINQKDKKLLEINRRLKKIKTQIRKSETLSKDSQFELRSQKNTGAILLEDLFTEFKIPLEYTLETTRLILNESSLNNQEEKEFLQRLKTKTKQVLNIVGELKKLERISSHPQEIRKKRLELEDFYSKIVSQANAFLNPEKWRINLNYSVPGNLVSYIDEEKFKNVNFDIIKWLTQNISAGEISIKVFSSKQKKNIQVQIQVSPGILSQDMLLESTEKFELLNKLYESSFNFGFVLIKNLLRQLNCQAEFKIQKATQKKSFIIFVPVEKQKQVK